MADFPRFEETQPVLNIQQVNSKAEGYEAFAKTLAKMSEQTEQKAETIVQEQSNASFLQAATQAESLKTNAHIEMLQHPDQAGKIAENYATNADQLNQSAFVNKQDRQKLASITAGDNNEIRLKAAGVAYQQSQKSLSIAYWDAFPVAMKSIQEALLSGDLEKAKTLEESLHQASLNAAQVGAITPEQFSSIRRTNFALYDRVSDFLKIAKDPDKHTAANYHAAAASPFNTQTANNSHYPAESNTQWLANHYNNDRTMQGQYAALYDDQPLNWGVVLNGNENQYQEFLEQVQGVNQLKASLHAGTSFAEIDHTMKSLDGMSNLLSNGQKGAFNYWKRLKNDIQNGDGYLRIMSQTTQGGQYTQEYSQQLAAIKSSAKTDQEKFVAQQETDNDYIGKMISLGQAQHVDPNYIRPIPAAMVNTVKNAFFKDAPVANAIHSIGYIKPQYRGFLADAMAKPEQAVSVFIAGSTLNKADASFQAQLIEANQERDYSALLKTEKDETKDANIWDDIASDQSIVNLNKYFSKLPGGVEFQAGFKKAAVNYVLYRSAKEGDINLNGKAKYVQDFVRNVSKGFEIESSPRYIFNGADLNLRKADMDYIADYALSNAYRALHVGRSEAEFQRFVDLNPLQVTNTPDGRIVVIDQQGHAAVTTDGYPAYDMPYTSSVLDAAHRNVQKTQDYMGQYFGVFENLKREGLLHPGFLFTIPEPEKTAKSLKKTTSSLLNKITFGRFGNEEIK